MRAVVLILGVVLVAGCPAKQPPPSVLNRARTTPPPAPIVSKTPMPLADGPFYVRTTWPGGRQPRVHRPYALRAYIHTANCSACMNGKLSPSTKKTYGRWDGPFATFAKAQAKARGNVALPDMAEPHGCTRATPSGGLKLGVGRSKPFCPPCQKKADRGLIENVGRCGLELNGCTTKTSSGMIRACGNCAGKRTTTCTMCLRPLDWYEPKPR